MMISNRHMNLAGSDILIGETPVGKGLFVTRSYAPDEEILLFTGREIDFDATLAKGDRECDAFQVAPGRYIDLDPPGVYINHSCDPNTGVRDGFRLVALTALQPGEEIRFDYSTTMGEDHWTLQCSCGSPRCRGIIRDFKFLPRELQIERVRRQIVPQFLIDAEVAGGRLTADDVRLV